jgi:hypothetical protein
MRGRVLGLLVLAALLPALLVLAPLAYASPPDPVWVSGFFDGGDHDDVVVLVVSTGAATDTSPTLGDATAPADPIWSEAVLSIVTRHAPSCRTPRAPPLV